MSDDTRADPSDQQPDDHAPVDRAAFERLREEVTDLRLQLEREVRTRRVVVADEVGTSRIRLSAEAGDCQVVLLDPDGFERLTLEGCPGHGALRLAGRAELSEPNRVDVFAVDPEDDQGVYVGVELVDAGTSVAGFTVIEGHRPRTWTART
jgi:hypothetical protein